VEEALPHLEKVLRGLMRMGVFYARKKPANPRWILQVFAILLPRDCRCRSARDWYVDLEWVASTNTNLASSQCWQVHLRRRCQSQYRATWSIQITDQQHSA